MATYIGVQFFRGHSVYGGIQSLFSLLRSRYAFSRS